MAMASKALEAKHEKMIRAMLKESFNKRCFTCEALGPQYVCTCSSRPAREKRANETTN